MRIDAVRFTRQAHPRPHLIVQIRGEDGRTGAGEASPLPPFSTEDVAACESALATASVRLRDLDDHARPADAIERALEPLGLDPTPSARFAVESALLDLLGQHRGFSVARCLSGEAATYATVPANALLRAAPWETLADRAHAIAREGFVAIKIKLRSVDDGEFAGELAALREVRARLPLPFELRLDANAAWSLDLARRRLDALAPIAPRYVEQPVDAPLLHRLDGVAVPWAADESLARPELVDAVLAARDCAAFILKPAILGGLGRARALALRAQARGVEVVVTHFFDGPLAVAAACELALSLPRSPLACGLAPHDDLAQFCGRFDVPQLARRCLVQSSGGPGLRVWTEVRA